MRQNHRRVWRRKGFLYAVEGIIAALIIFGYVGQFLTLPLHRTDWNQAQLQQQSRELLSALDVANLTPIIVENRQQDLSGLLRFFLGETRGFSVTTLGLPKPTIRVGVWVNGSDVITMNLDTADCEGKQTDDVSLCLTNAATDARFTTKFLVVDNDTNLLRDYDSVWIDTDGNGVLDEPNPLVVNQIFTAGADTFSVGAIPPNGSFITFYNASLARQFAERFPPFTLNGRRVVFAFTPVSVGSDLSPFDAVVFKDYKNLSTHFQVLSNFLDLGKGLLEIVDFTSQPQVDDDAVQRELFGLAWTGKSASGFYTLNPIESVFETAELAQLFNATPIRIDTSAISTNYTGSGGENRLSRTDDNLDSFFSANGLYHYGFFANFPRVADPNYTFVVMNSSTVYDRAYINHDKDIDTVVLGPFVQGDVTPVFGSDTFTIKRIDPNGNFVEVTPSTGHTFADIGGRNVRPTRENATQFVLLNVTDDVYGAIGNIRVTGGRAAWVAGGIAPAFIMDDEVALLRALLLWVSDKRHEVVRERLLQNSASTSSVLTAKGDLFQPFTIFLRVWYSV